MEIHMTNKGMSLLGKLPLNFSRCFFLSWCSPCSYATCIVCNPMSRQFIVSPMHFPQGALLKISHSHVLFIDEGAFYYPIETTPWNTMVVDFPRHWKSKSPPTGSGGLNEKSTKGSHFSDRECWANRLNIHINNYWCKGGKKVASKTNP